MLTIKLYQFSKNKNSTKQPDNSVTQVSYSALMKTASSLINPVITIKESPIGYNYCYISDFERYYFITDITYSLGEWELSLSVDSLASFKSDLGNVTTYVLRSASNKNGYLKDSLYPISGNYSKSVQNWDPWGSGGYYYLSAVGINSVHTYQLSSAAMRSFMTNLMGYSTDASLWGTVEQSLMNSAFNPIQFITSCFYSPLNLGQNVATSTIECGNYSVSVSGDCYINSRTYRTFSHSFSVADHPQASVRGMYCNMAPYTSHTLSAGGFGVINVPADLLDQGSNTVEIELLGDPRTGAGALICKANGVRFARVNSSIGVNVPIAQTSRDIIGGSVSLMSGIAGGIASAVTGNIPGAIASAGSILGGITDLASNITSTTGAQGSGVNLYDDFTLTSVWYTNSGFDNDNNGCPYCQTVQLNTLSGFTQCEKGVFKSSKATESEINEINSYMVSGFYYE